MSCDVKIPVAGAEKPLTIDELCSAISKANGGAEVKFVGYEEFNAVDLATKPIEELNAALADDMKITPQLHEILKKTVKG